jgi:uncharacterized protein YdhG (YjbR/CyaY superfamily)
MARNPETIDEYLAGLSDEKRAALQKLRRTIRSIVPEAEECMSYRIPAFRLHGRVLVWFGAASGHCALYPRAYPIRAHKEALGEYDTSKGTIRFQAERPLPTALVRRLIRTCIEAHIASKPVSTKRGKRRG